MLETKSDSELLAYLASELHKLAFEPRVSRETKEHLLRLTRIALYLETPPTEGDNED